VSGSASIIIWLVGPTGIASRGWLCFGHKACARLSVLYKRASRLFTDLGQARGEVGCRGDERARRTPPLIIDDWGRNR
jgi:DNA replication protein DnaC